MAGKCATFLFSVLFVVVSLLFLKPAVHAAPGEETLIPLPDVNAEPPQNHPGDKEILIPLPKDRNPPDIPAPGKGTVPPKTPPKKNPALIPIPDEPATQTSTITLTPSTGDGVITIEPTPPTPEPTQAAAAPPTAPTPAPTPTGSQSGKPANPLPAFPKDTSSAVFMLMKTWECQDYDGKTLLDHAIGVYGKEAEDKFEVKGLDTLPKFNVTLKEDDVTLDELLDIMANKSGFDWGVDIPGKTIYLYPGGK